MFFGDIVKTIVLGIVIGISMNLGRFIQLSGNASAILTNSSFLTTIFGVVIFLAIAHVLSVLIRARHDWSGGFEEGYKQGQYIMKEADKA